jgi:hypothetical protein
MTSIVLILPLLSLVATAGVCIKFIIADSFYAHLSLSGIITLALTLFPTFTTLTCARTAYRSRSNIVLCSTNFNAIVLTPLPAYLLIFEKTGEGFGYGIVIMFLLSWGVSAVTLILTILARSITSAITQARARTVISSQDMSLGPARRNSESLGNNS